MRKGLVVSVVVTVSALITGCTFSDSERCGDGFVYQDNNCVRVNDAVHENDGGIASGVDGAIASDARVHADDAGSTVDDGLGKLCNPAADECAGYAADYCVAQPGATEGYCSYSPCDVTSNDWPAQWHCCDMPFDGVPLFCVRPEDWEGMRAMCSG
jgi:hypothetical protein